MARIERPDTAFRDAPRQRKTPRAKSNEYLGWVKGLPCVITGRHGVDVAHIRYMDRRFAKRGLGVAEKAGDHWTLPLSRQMHTEQHSMGEKQFWEYYGVDPVVVAAALYIVFTMYDGDEEMARIVLAQKGRI